MRLFSENGEPLKEQARAARGIRWIEQMLQDARHGARSLKRSPGFTAVVVVTLALGVGATTAIFSVVNGVLLRPLPFPDPDQLVLLGERVPAIPQLSQRFQFWDTPSAFLAWREQATDFQGMAALQGTSFTLLGQGAPRVLRGARVTPGFFAMLDAKPELGRFFTPEDATASPRPMVITEALWRSVFNADPGVVGRTVGEPGHEVQLIGVLPDHARIAGKELGPMTAGKPTEFFFPFEFGPDFGGSLTSVWSNFNFTVIGRLKPGVTPALALAQLNVIQARLAADAPDEGPGELLAQVTPILDYATESSRQGLWLLLGAVGAVLLVISVNLGGLWVSRVVDRRRDWAIRLALGAKPGRLVRQVLAEGVTLGLIGGVLGVAAAAASLRGLLALAPADTPRLDQVHVDWRVLAAGLALSVAAGLVTGLVPALRVGRGDPHEPLKAGSTATTAGAASVRSRQGLIGLQAALSTVLMAVAGLLGFSLYGLMTKPTGFSTDHAVQAEIVISSYGGAERDQIMQQITTAVEAIPGVETAALSSHLPLQGETWIDGAGAPGKEYPPGQRPAVNVRFIGGKYFSTMGIPLIAGRAFRDSDRPAGEPPENGAEAEETPRTVVISAATARLIWPERDPRSLVAEPMIFNGRPATIVGVAADALDGTLTSAAPAVVYQPYWDWGYASAFSLVLRTSLPLSAIAVPVRAAVAELAPNAPVPEIRRLSTLRAAATASQRYQFTLLMTFAGLALLLAAIGVYALVAHSIARRRKELAIRLALGAPATSIRALIAGQALIPVGVGALVGVVVALAGGRLLQSLLYQVSASDPRTLAVAAGVVLLAAAVACILPALRATRVDPNSALRAE